jgi:hypothetical protein
MWNHFKSIDLAYLNTFQHFIVKRIQNLRSRTRSDNSYPMTVFYRRLYANYISGFSLVGLVRTIICTIFFTLKRNTIFVNRKLLFFQKLCSLDDNFIARRIFTTRLFSYFADNSRKHFGFVRDLRFWILFTIKCWNVLRYARSIDLKWFHI